MLSSALVGFFDSTIGWRLCLTFNANLGAYKEQSLNTPAYARVLAVMLLSMAVGYAGHLMTV